jgi:hypothetical protein
VPCALFCATISGFVYFIFLTSFGTIPAFDIFKHAMRYIFMPLAPPDVHKRGVKTFIKSLKSAITYSPPLLPPARL